MTVIHLVSGGDYGGAKTHVISLLDGLRQTEKAVLVCFQDGPFAADAQKKQLDVRIVAPRNPIKALRALKSIVNDLQPDLIHCHGSRANMMGALLKLSHKKLPVVTTVHSDYKLDYLGRRMQGLLYGTVNRISLRRLDALIGVSSAMKRLLIQRKFSPYNLFSIYGGIDFTPPEPLQDKASAFAELGVDWQVGDVVAGCVARLSPVKDIATLLRAYALARNECPRLRIVIAGNGEEEDMLKRLAASLGIADRVTFLGWISQPERVYRLLDINLLTSVTECFPYVLLEGARYRLATISTAVGGIPDLIVPHRNGLLFEPKDTQALAAHLTLLANNESLRRQWGDALYETGATHFSEAAMIETQLNIYQTLLRRAKRPHCKRDSIVLCGSYGRGNAGDDAILQAALAEIHAIDPDLRPVVLSRNPLSTRCDFDVDAIYTFRIFKFAKALRHSKLFINGGGNLLQDVTSKRSLWFYLFTIWLAHHTGNRVLMYGCGIGPVNGGFNRRLTARVLNNNVDTITLRESLSLQELTQYGVTKPQILVTSDLAFSLLPADAEAVDAAFLQHKLDPHGAYFCLALRQWPQFSEKAALFGQLADYVSEKYNLTPLFIPFEAAHDEAAALLAAAQTTVPYVILPHMRRPTLVIGVLSRMQAVLSMRLHALIFASSQSVPVLAVSYDSKVNAFMAHIENPNVAELKSVTIEQLKAMADNALTAVQPVAAAEQMRTLEQLNTKILRAALER